MLPYGTLAHTFPMIPLIHQVCFRNTLTLAAEMRFTERSGGFEGLFIYHTGAQNPICKVALSSEAYDQWMT